MIEALIVLGLLAGLVVLVALAVSFSESVGTAGRTISMRPSSGRQPSGRLRCSASIVVMTLADPPV